MINIIHLVYQHGSEYKGWISENNVIFYPEISKKILIFFLVPLSCLSRNYSMLNKLHVRQTKVRAVKVQGVWPPSHTYTLSAPNIQSGLSLQTPLRLCPPHHPQPPKHPDCMYSPLSPPAAVHLIHDPTIIRQSSAGPFPAQGDTHDDSEIYYFQRNICKWRQSEARVAPIFHRDMWLWKLMVNTLLFCLFHPHLVCSNTHLHVYFLLLDFKYSAAVATGKNWDFTPGFLQSN